MAEWRRMTLAVCLAVGLIGPGKAAPPAKPRRIMSIMLCDDLLLMMLVPRERIASISYLAHNAAQAIMPGADRGIAVNHGAVEEVLREKPDLILSGTYSTPVTRRLAKRVGAPLLEAEPINSFEDIRRVTRRIGAAVGEPERAERLIARMDATLARLAATRPARSVRVVAWSGGGSVPGRGTLHNAIIEAAGATNIAAKFPDGRYGSFGTEELLAARPDAILQGEDRWDAPSLRGSLATHPLVRRLYRGRRIVYPDPLYTCGLPQSADAAVALRAALRRLPPSEARW